MPFPAFTNNPDEAGTWLRPKLVASWYEIAAVIILSLGNAALVSTQIALDRHHKFYSQPSGDRSLLYNIAFEAVILFAFLAYLHLRGWKTTDFKIRTSWKATLQVFLLLLAVEVSQVVCWFILILVVYCAYKFAHLDLRLKSNLTPTKTVFSYHNEFLSLGFWILNAFSEELICIGYAFNQIASKKGPLVALFVTLFLRITYHTWQGPFQIFATLTLFLVFGLFYWRYKILWPLVVAHALFDMLPFASFKILKLIFSML